MKVFIWRNGSLEASNNGEIIDNLGNSLGVILARYPTARLYSRDDAGAELFPNFPTRNSYPFSEVSREEIKARFG